MDEIAATTGSPLKLITSSLIKIGVCVGMSPNAQDNIEILYTHGRHQIS